MASRKADAQPATHFSTAARFGEGEPVYDVLRHTESGNPKAVAQHASRADARAEAVKQAESEGVAVR